MARKPTELLSLAGIARETGRTRQTLREQISKLPPADFVTGAGIRETLLWRRSTLERAGILEPADSSDSPIGGVPAQVRKTDTGAI